VPEEDAAAREPQADVGRGVFQAPAQGRAQVILLQHRYGYLLLSPRPAGQPFGYDQEVSGVPRSRIFQVAAHSQPLIRVLAYGFEQAVTRPPISLVHHNQRLVHQPAEQLQNRGLVN